MPSIKNVQFLIIILLSQLFCSCPAQTLSPLPEIKTLLQQKALHPPTKEWLARLTTKNLEKELRAFDSHARYIPADSLAHAVSPALRIGLDVFLFKSKVWVTPEPEGPAEKQHFPEVGQLQRVSGVWIGDDLQRASKLIDKAIADNLVILEIADRDNGRLEHYRILPEDYTSPSVSSRTIDNALIIRIGEFVSHETAPFFSGLYSTVAVKGGTTIIDLRGCPGGDLFEALEIAGLFVPAGLPLITTYDQKGKVHTYLSPPGEKLSAPTYLLMDIRTASAAEILAGILKIHGLSRLVGDRSYGKCESQTIFDLTGGGELWLTTLAVHFSDESSCNKKGVQPDISLPDISLARLSGIVHKLVKR